MAVLEEFLDTITHKPKIWKRFIDDIFMIWSHGETAFKNPLDKLNKFHPISFLTWTHSHTLKTTT